MRIYSKRKPGPGWKQDAVLWQGPEGLTCKTGQGDRPYSSNPNGNPDRHWILGYSLNSLGQSTWGRITTPSSAIIPDLSGDVQVCST